MIDLKKLCQKYGIDLEIGEMSDGYHTFNSLYHQRLILFAALVNAYPDISWKAKRHEDGEECFGGGWFLVGIDTPEGSYTYHYELKYWDLFKCKELYKGRHWDGHTDKDVERLLSIRPSWKEKGMGISLNIEEYCKDCMDFEADVSKFRIENLCDSFRYITTIECKNKDRCKSMFNHLINYAKRWEEND